MSVHPSITFHVFDFQLDLAQIVLGGNEGERPWPRGDNSRKVEKKKSKSSIESLQNQQYSSNKT
jgi:hypothetical protein